MGPFGLSRAWVDRVDHFSRGTLGLGTGRTRREVYPIYPVHPRVRGAVLRPGKAPLPIRARMMWICERSRHGTRGQVLPPLVCTPGAREKMRARDTRGQMTRSRCNSICRSCRPGSVARTAAVCSCNVSERVTFPYDASPGLANRNVNLLAIPQIIGVYKWRPFRYRWPVLPS